MNLEYLHLYLGLTRSELKRRLELGQLDFHAIESQISDLSHEIKLQALCDRWLENHRQDEQVDKFAADIESDIAGDKGIDLK